MCFVGVLIARTERKVAHAPVPLRALNYIIIYGPDNRPIKVVYAVLLQWRGARKGQGIRHIIERAYAVTRPWPGCPRCTGDGDASGRVGVSVRQGQDILRCGLWDVWLQRWGTGKGRGVRRMEGAHAVTGP